MTDLPPGRPRRHRNPGAGSGTSDGTGAASSQPDGQPESQPGSQPDDQPYIEPNSRSRNPPDDEYGVVLAELTRDLEPQDYVDRLWIQNIAKLVMDANLIRRAKEAAIRAGIATAYTDVAYRPQAIAEVGLGPDATRDHLESLAHEVNSLEEDDINTVEVILRANSLNRDDLKGGAYFRQLQVVETVEKLLMLTEGRRDYLIKSYERRKSSRPMNITPQVVPGREVG